MWVGGVAGRLTCVRFWMKALAGQDYNGDDAEKTLDVWWICVRHYWIGRFRRCVKKGYPLYRASY